MRLNHLNIATNDINASQEFYESFFNFRKLFDADGEIFLGNQEGDLLALLPIDSPVDSPNWLHFGFCVQSAEEVQRLYKQMKSKGIKFVEELSDSDGHFAMFYVSDPAGHRVEVSWHKI